MTLQIDRYEAGCGCGELWMEHSKNWRMRCWTVLAGADTACWAFGPVIDTTPLLRLNIGGKYD
jgi:hypothetical protein